MEESRPGEYIPVFENERGTFIFNSKDLCMIEHIPEMISAGINSFKVEGRMKTALYVAVVTRAYRKAIDDYRENPDKYQANLKWYREEIEKCTNRQFTTGFYFGKPDESAQIYGSSTYQKNYTYLGTVEQVMPDGKCRIHQKNKFWLGEEIEVMKPDGQNILVKVLGIEDEEGISMESAPHARQVLYVDLGAELKEYDILRRAEI